MNIETEYKSLREEIVRLEKDVLTITFYVFSITLIIAGLELKNSEYSNISPILYQIVLIWGLGRYMSCTKLRMKLSTYLQVFIEPKSEYLKWEKRNFEHKKISDTWLNKWLNRFSNLFSLLTILGIYITFHFFNNDYSCNIDFWIIALATIILQFINLYLVITAVFCYPDQSKYLESWKQILEQEKLDN